MRDRSRRTVILVDLDRFNPPALRMVESERYAVQILAWRLVFL
jgi:hypothetical protein